MPTTTQVKTYINTKNAKIINKSPGGKLDRVYSTVYKSEDGIMVEKLPSLDKVAKCYYDIIKVAEEKKDRTNGTRHMMITEIAAICSNHDIAIGMISGNVFKADISKMECIYRFPVDNVFMGVHKDIKNSIDFMYISKKKKGET